VSLHLVIEDNTEDPQVPELAPMDVCDVCGDTTETAPPCFDCSERQVDEDAARRYRQGREWE